MLGAIIGDTVGSVYEFNNILTPDFQPLLAETAKYTDDSILSVAVADWLLNTDRSQQQLEDRLVDWGTRYPDPKGGYGNSFYLWLFEPLKLSNGWQNASPAILKTLSKRHPYNSCGNGSAMRASACGWVAGSLEEALDLGKRSAEVTHNHPEGIKGAQAVAAAIYMALRGESKTAIRDYIERTFGYDLQHTCEEIRPECNWSETCQETVPPAIIAFLDSHNFEESIRLAVSLGGDSDTIACITGGIADAYYSRRSDAYKVGITSSLREEMHRRLPQEMWNIVTQVENFYK